MYLFYFCRPKNTKMKKKHPIVSLIEQGEHQQLDFKFEVSDSKKIARTLSAFANTEIEELVIPDSVTETSGGIVEMLNLKKLVIPNTLNFSFIFELFIFKFCKIFYNCWYCFFSCKT